MHPAPLLSHAADRRNRDLSPIYADFVRRSLAEPASWDASGFDWSRIAMATGAASERVQPWPIIVAQQRHAAIADLSVQLVELLRSLPGRLFGGSTARFCEALGIDRPPGLSDEVGPLTGLADCVARTDVVLTRSGPKVLECNLGPGIGGWQVYMLEKRYRDDPHISRLLGESGLPMTALHPMGRLMAHAHEVGVRHFMSERTGEPITVALAVPDPLLRNARVLMPAPPPASDQPLKGPRICFGPNATLGYENDRVTIDGAVAHVVVAMDCDSQPAAPLVEAQRRGRLVLLNAPEATLLGHKSALAILSAATTDPAFSPAERALIRRTVPWTRQVHRGTTERFRGDPQPVETLLMHHQKHLVLKPSDGHSGIGVVLGARSSPAQWRQRVDEALDTGDSIVQELCVPPTFLAPHEGRVAVQDLIWSVFVYGNRHGGSWVRMMPHAQGDGVLNSARGASETIVLQHP